MTTTPVPKDNSTSPRIATLTRLALLATVWIVVLTISAGVFHLGIRLRHWAWTNTESMHFQGDVTHAYLWGTTADQNGLLGMYRQIRADYGDQPDMQHGLDYAPLRLTIMTLWARWVNQHFDPEDQWDPAKSYAFHRPLLMANAACEAAAAVGVVLVLRLMRQIVNPGADHNSSVRGLAREYLPLVIAALLVWFNPVLILNDCWPQWDAWILPSFIFALYFSMRGWWFTAGTSGPRRHAQGSNTLHHPGLSVLAAVYRPMVAAGATRRGRRRCHHRDRDSLDAHLTRRYRLRLQRGNSGSIYSDLPQRLAATIVSAPGRRRIRRADLVDPENPQRRSVMACPPLSIRTDQAPGNGRRRHQQSRHAASRTMGLGSQRPSRSTAPVWPHT